MLIVDAYAHCGLSKYEPIEKVRAAMEKAGVSRTVLVQHMGEYDNTYIGSAVESDPEHFAGVLIVDHRDPKVVETLGRWHSTKHFQGIRLATEVLSAAKSLFSVAGDLGLVIVLFAPDGIRPTLPLLEKELEAAPFTRLVVTHLGNPKVTGNTVDESARDVFRLARFANVYLQLSGMKMFCPYPHEPMYPFVAEAVEHFGPSRILWGSNFPVVGTTEDYVKDLRLLLDGRLPIPKDAIAKIAGENADRLWFGRGP